MFTSKVVLTLKKADLMVQLVALGIMVFCFQFLGPFALYIVAVVQLFSLVYWKFWDVLGQSLLPFHRGIYKMFGWTLVIITVGGLIDLVVAEPVCLFCLSLLLLFFGPILGITYFLTTLKEVVYLNKRINHKLSFR